MFKYKNLDPETLEEAECEVYKRVTYFCIAGHLLEWFHIIFKCVLGFRDNKIN